MSNTNRANAHAIANYVISDNKLICIKAYSVDQHMSSKAWDKITNEAYTEWLKLKATYGSLLTTLRITLRVELDTMGQTFSNFEMDMFDADKRKRKRPDGTIRVVAKYDKLRTMSPDKRKVYKELLSFLTRDIDSLNVYLRYLDFLLGSARPKKFVVNRDEKYIEVNISDTVMERIRTNVLVNNIPPTTMDISDVNKFICKRAAIASLDRRRSMK